MIDFIVTLAILGLLWFLNNKLYKLSVKLTDTINYFTRLHEIIFNNTKLIEDKLTDNAELIDDLQESIFELEERLTNLEDK